MSPRSRAARKRTHDVYLLAALSSLATTAIAGYAHAADHIPVQLSFVGAAECGDRSLLEREVERRSEVVQWAVEGEGAVEVDVHIWGGDSRFEASVFVENPGAPPVARAITGSTCQEVIEGAALIIAVLLPPVNTRQSRLTTERPTRKPDLRLPVKKEPLHWRFGGGTAGVLMWGIAPSFLPGFEVFADVSTSTNGWAPAFRLAFRHAARTGFAADAGDVKAAFRLISGVASACPVAWLPHRTLTLRPCVTGALGSLQGSVSGADASQTENHPWAALGGGLRLEVRLAEALSVQLEGTTEVGLFTGRFWFSGVDFHDTSRLNERIGVSLVARIPE